ncbi:hypothetical protein V490_06148 [Pseudogymnoascus sp. VKM F-3557]|nr:hypothetical protein V490_06148 [Pseudogymnoascus sp. VKM F-3557]
MGGQNFDGLRWAKVGRGQYGMEARFAHEPNLEVAKELFESFGIATRPIVIAQIETQEEYGRVYNVSTGDIGPDLILRINLPLEPRHKTLSEVATIEWVHKNTNIPVPKIIHYDASNHNPIGFEYILMTKLPGKPLTDEVWKSISFAAKEELIKRLAELSASLYKKQFRGIGSLYSAFPPKIGPVLDSKFFWHDNINLDVPRGPFSSAREWYHATLKLKQQAAISTIAGLRDAVVDAYDKIDQVLVQSTLQVISRVRPLIDKILPVGSLGGDEAEPSMLFHESLNWYNILVDDSGALTGILDWQCTPVVPVWSACTLPAVIDFEWRDTKPDPEEYHKDANGEPEEQYWVHLGEYECGLLRPVFLREMERLAPGWLEAFNGDGVRFDLGYAVSRCDTDDESGGGAKAADTILKTTLLYPTNRTLYSIMAKADFQGLKWTQTLWGLEPTWSISPDPAAIAELIKSLGLTNASISFLAQGAFNKVYTVTSPENEDLILRLSLPVDPRFKTLSEVATMEWMRSNTSIPVARVIRYAESRANIVGCEWILMSTRPGKHLADTWRTMSYAAKEALVKRIAGVWVELFRRPLRGVGNIYSSSEEKGGPPEVGRIVSMQFFWGGHIHQDVSRGPFSSSREWLLTRPGLYEYECRDSLVKYEGKGRERMESDDEDEIEDAERTLDIVARLKVVVDKIFPAGQVQQGDEESLFFHDDLSNHNVLVGDDGALTGVLDWECVSAVPRWKACFFPSFLEGKPRDVKPGESKYQVVDGEACDLYWKHVLEYELTNLRRVFLDEMARLEPGWMEVFNESQLKRDLDDAVLNCDSELSARAIRCWSDDVIAERSNMLTLGDRYNGCYGPDVTRDTVAD